MIILGLFMGSFFTRAFWDLLVTDEEKWKNVENGAIYVFLTIPFDWLPIFVISMFHHRNFSRNNSGSKDRSTLKAASENQRSSSNLDKDHLNESQARISRIDMNHDSGTILTLK